MPVAVLHSRALSGFDAPPVTVEVHLAGGLPSFNLVGLPETEVKESRDRVRAALQNAHFEFPARRITANLAPADLPKESGRFDLPIALGILAATGQIPATAFATHEFAGELALTGELRPIRGALAMTLKAHRDGRAFVLPVASAREAALVRDAVVYPAPSLLAVCAHLAGRELLPRCVAEAVAPCSEFPDLGDVRGQAFAKRALEVAAAGRHSLLMQGPPGTGKSMLAQRLPGLLPALTEDEALEAAAIHSLTAGFRPEALATASLSRAASHRVGGSAGRRRQRSTARRDFARASRRAVPRRTSGVGSARARSIARAARIGADPHFPGGATGEFPARFQFVAAMNPCPCGYLGHGGDKCRCTPDQIARYRARISGPLLDRIDLQIEVPAIAADAFPTPLQRSADGEVSAVVRERVAAAAQRQRSRQGMPNAWFPPKDVERLCTPDARGAALLKAAFARMSLSARAYHRILKVARTIADLAFADAIAANHVAEAIGYRRLDRS